MAEQDAAKGLAVFADELRAAPRRTRLRVSGALTRHTNRINRAAYAKIPIGDTGWLKARGIRHDTQLTARRVYSELDTDKASEAEPEGADVLFHVEFGTSTTPPHPILMPAFEAEQIPFANEVRRIVDEALE